MFGPLHSEMLTLKRLSTNRPTPNHALHQTAPRVTELLFWLVPVSSGRGVVLRPVPPSALHLRSYRATLRRR